MPLGGNQAQAFSRVMVGQKLCQRFLEYILTFKKDDKLIIKRLLNRWTLAEKNGLLAFTPSYLGYLNETDKKLSILSKIFGFYTVTYKNVATGQSYESDYLVMEHLFVNEPVGKVSIKFPSSKRLITISEI